MLGSLVDFPNGWKVKNTRPERGSTAMFPGRAGSSAMIFNDFVSTTGLVLRSGNFALEERESNERNANRMSCIIVDLCLIDDLLICFG